MAIPYDPVNDFFSGLGKQPITPTKQPSTDPASSFFGEISQRQGQPQVQTQPVQQPVVQPKAIAPEINPWKKIADDLLTGAKGAISSFLKPKQEPSVVGQPFQNQLATQAKAVVKDIGKRAAEAVFPMMRSEQEIKQIQDVLVKNYDSAITKTLASWQKKEEEEMKKKPLLYGFTKGITRLMIGNTKSFDEYWNTETLVPQNDFGKTQATIGEFIANVAAWHYGGRAIKAVGAVKATLPILFVTMGQLSEPIGVTLQDRIKRIPNDLITSWLFGKVPVTFKAAPLAGLIFYGSAVADRLTKGMPLKQAMETSITTGIIGSLFHATNVAYGRFVTPKILEKGQTFTPDEIRQRSEGIDIPPETKKAFEKIAMQAEAIGKDVKLEVIAVKESRAAKIVGKEVVEQVTGRPQEIKLTNGEGTNAIIKIEFVEQKGKLPGKPEEKKETVKPEERKVITLEKKSEGVKSAAVTIKPDGTAGMVIEIEPKMQKKGIGTQVVKELEAKAVEAGAKKATISAFVESQGFWEKQGYSVVQGATEEKGMIKMEKDITPVAPSVVAPSGKQTEWIIDQIYNNEDSPTEMKNYLMREGGISEEMATHAVDLREWVSRQGRVVTHAELAKKLKQEWEIDEEKAAIPKELEPLAQEARKYKSAEEFVKAKIGEMPTTGASSQHEWVNNKIELKNIYNQATGGVGGEALPVKIAPEKPPQVTTEASNKRIQEISDFFQAKYGKPIEKGTAKEINEVWVTTEALPITPKSEPIYKKVVSPTRGINVKYFETNPTLLFGGIEREMFIDGYSLITDKTVAGEINKKFVEAWEKDLIKSYQGSNKEITYVEAEKLAKENTARLVEEGKEKYPKPEIIEKIIPKEWGKAVKPLGFKPNGTQGTFVYLSDEKYEVAVSGDKLVAMQKYLPDATIHLSGTITPVVFVQDGKSVGVLMPVRLNDDAFPKEFSRIKETKEEPKAEAPAYKGGQEGAAVGKFANLENVTKQRNERPDLPSFRSVPFPEIVRIVKGLTGKVPKLNKRLIAFGRTRPDTLGIEMKPSVFDDPDQAALTLTHELGHITDYLPESEQRTGNLLGRIASLKGYFKHWLSEFPGGLGKMLTDKEKRQLRKEAEELAKKPVTEEKEIVVSEKTPTPEEILDIWRINTASIDNPELLSYIQKLPDELKKDIVKAALKSTVPKWVTFTRKIKEKITVGVIRSAPEDIQRLYKELLHKEILKRRLIELKTVRQELMALSAIWRPFDRMKSSDNYVKYRDRPSELYADAISVLYSDPERLKMQAPEFYRGFFNYLNQKPEVAEEYYQIQHLLSRGSDEVNKERIEEIYKGFEEGAEKRKEAFEKQMKKKSIWFRATTQHISKFHPIYNELDKAIKEGKIDISRKQQMRETLEIMAYSRNDVWLDLEKNETEVLEPLKKAGITEKQLGAWFMLERNLGDRLGIANPDGLIGDFNKEVKEYLSKNFTPEQSEVMQAGVKKFHEETFAIAQEMYNEGMIPEKVYKERIEPYKDSYVTYGVVKYIDKNYVTPYLKEMIGTLEKIENPLVTTMYKRASMLQALAVHKAKKQVVAFLREIAPDEITVSKSVMGIKHQRIYRPAPGRGQIVLQEDGKWISYDVDPYFEQMFKQFDPKDLHTLAHVAGQFNKYFKPIVTTYKLGWAAYNNPLRDVQRTMKNLAAVSKIEGIPFDRAAFLKEWITSIPEAFRFSGGRLTPLAKQALGEHAISTPWVSYDPTAGEDKALYTLYQKYRVFGLDGDPKADKRITQKMLLPIEMVLKALERTGGTFESTTKLAGFKYLSKRMEDQGKAGFYTRNYVGTPNYLEGGAMKEIDNSLWVFSNVIFQGYRSDAELIRNPKSRGAWFFESFLQSGFWKLLMVIAASGFLGKQLQDAYENMTEYHKSNFLAVPLAQTPGGKTLYWTVPQDETNRLMGSIIWKTGMALQGKLVKPQQILDIGAGFVPTITPIFSVVGAWFDYIRGINPWDSYYGRNVLDQQTQKIRGVEGVRKMALWSLNEVGLGNFATYDPATRTTEEKFIQFTPLINRMFKVSDYGITEREVEGERKEEQQRAIQNKKESDLVKKYIEELKKEDGDPEALKERLAEELYPEGIETTEEQANLNRVNKDFDQELLKRENDTRINTIMKLKLNTSKINSLRGFAEDMKPEAFEDLLNKLYDAKVISKEVFNAVIE